ncbi:MAG: L,D-transpeptidase family protein [Nitriliruptorales bacterium]|nr:L,D-transpeptidase family protein [Nitriliruptorales bacterium]
MRSRRLLALAATLVTAMTTVGAAAALAWGATLRDDGRLLQGTTIASVDVSGATADEALAAVESRLAARLDRDVEVTYDEHRWETTARQLGATTDVDRVIAEALERTAAAELIELAFMRLTGESAGLELDVTVRVPDDNIDTFIAGVAEELDRAPSDAHAAWDGDGFELTEDRTGRRVDRDAAVADLGAALDGGATVVELPVETLAPDVTTEVAQGIVTDTSVAIDAALDHAVTLAVGGSSWTVTPRELGAAPDVEPLLAAAFAAPDSSISPADVKLVLPDGAISNFIATIAASVDQAPRDAQLDWAAGRLQITPEQTGSTLARDAAATELRAALGGAADRVELSMVPAEPAVTSASFGHTLVVNQAQRRLYYYQGGKVVQDWPVAVGQGGSPTPTGVFTVGAKRHEPTWHNPAPDGWGSNMPRSIGPGPDNPLGVRALNWNQNGRDTLIRFHGTPNEASIGQAASRGCVRMFNADVIELYNLVPTGTTILSVAG